MKNNISDTAFDLFTAYSVTNEEMLCVRGGEEDPVPKPNIPPIII